MVNETEGGVAKKEDKVKRENSAEISDESGMEKKHEKVKKRKSDKSGDNSLETREGKLSDDTSRECPKKQKKLKDEIKKEIINTHKVEGSDVEVEVDVKVSLVWLTF